MMAIKTIDYDTAKKEVIDYFKVNFEAYDYQIAEYLKLDYEMVCQIVDELENEGSLI